MKQLKDIVEGILDIDDLETSIEKNATKDIFIRVLGGIIREGKTGTDVEMDQLKNLIEAANAADANPASIPKRLRQKDNTAIIYFEQHPETRSEAIEVRAFVKNPRPFKCIIKREDKDNWRCRWVTACNHFTQLSRDILKRTMFLGPEVWNEIIGPRNKSYLR